MTAERQKLAAELQERWEKSEPPLGLRRSLFWDCMPGEVDAEKNARFVIERVIEHGGLADWKAIRRHYGDDRLRAVVTSLRSFSPQSVNFCCLALDLKKSDFRCCTEKHLHPAPWVY